MVTARLPEPAPPHERPSRFSHLVLKTARFEEMTSWYLPQDRILQQELTS